jgi:hypothetical protein
MTLNKDQVLTKFAAAALTLGVPADKTSIAAKQCFDSMARMAQKHAKEADRVWRKCHLPVLPRPAPDVALVDWLNSLSYDVQHGAILNNVRPYVGLYENDLAITAPDMVCEGVHSGLVLAIADNRVTQKINREGDTVTHDIATLSMAVKVGEVVDIQYQGGQGIVSGMGKSVGMGR